jgi:ABC-2 type transport system permease protein
MKELMYPLLAEFRKNKRSPIIITTFAAFSLGPVMGGIFMLLLRNPEALAKAGTFSSKAKLMAFTLDLNSYLSVLSQTVGVGGVLVFGFVASWIFGREYSEGTSKDLLSLPTSRTQILNAKFALYLLWCLALALTNLLVGFTIALLLQLPGWAVSIIAASLMTYLITTVLTVLLGSPIAFFALAGEGYLAPLGFVAMTLVLAQIVAATGYGNYFPWSIPGLFSGAGGAYRDELNALSYLTLLLTTVSGYLCSIFWWKYADQTR